MQQAVDPPTTPVPEDAPAPPADVVAPEGADLSGTTVDADGQFQGAVDGMVQELSSGWDRLGPDTQFQIILAVALLTVSILSTISAVFSFVFSMTFFRIPEESRKMSLGKVWLLTVPVFGLFWLQIVIRKLADSFQSYFLSEEDVPTPPGDFGIRRGMALWYVALASHALPFAIAMVFVIGQGHLLTNVWTLGIVLGVGILVPLWFGISYFRQVFKVRAHIPDPTAEEIRDYI